MRVIFLPSFTALCFLALHIRLDTERSCWYCQAVGQFVSHGNIRCCETNQTIGKRLLCDKRRGGTGCGRTTRLLNQDETYWLHFKTPTICEFIILIVAGKTITDAYMAATTAMTPRNAWRWWSRLRSMEHTLRKYLFLNTQFTDTSSPQIEPSEQGLTNHTTNKASKWRLKHHPLLECLEQFTSLNHLDSCAAFQQALQACWFSPSKLSRLI
jgi:hypothetical protein